MVSSFPEYTRVLEDAGAYPHQFYGTQPNNRIEGALCA